MLHSSHMRDPDTEEAPPFLGSWRNLYILVVMVLALDILLLFAFTKAFA